LTLKVTINHESIETTTSIQEGWQCAEEADQHCSRGKSNARKRCGRKTTSKI